jgi:hypothetical protein
VLFVCLDHLTTNVFSTQRRPTARPVASIASVTSSPRSSSAGFGSEPEVTANVLRRVARIDEAPISFSGRETDAGAVISRCEGLVALAMFTTHRFIE